MNVKINGEIISFEKEISVADYLESAGFRKEMVAVELNLSILPKSEYETTMLKDSDEVEIVQFMGGGSCRTGISPS